MTIFGIGKMSVRGREGDRLELMRYGLRTKVCDLLGCDVPVVLAGMGGVARANLVSAVSAAGGYGILGMVRESPEFIRRQIHEVRAQTEKDFGVNLIPAATPRDLFLKELQVCLEERVHSVCLFWDLDDEVILRLRDNGILVICQVGSRQEAIQALDAGAQILIAQGVESGGHVRGTQARLKLLADVVSLERDEPILTAGGIARGADLADALNHGAAGIVMGTSFLVTQEAFAHDYHKGRIVEASLSDIIYTQDFHINWPRDAYVRVLRNSVTDGDYGDPFSSERQIIGEDSGRVLYRFGTDSPLQSTIGKLEQMALYAGTGAAAISNIPTAAERMGEILAEAIDARREAIPQKPIGEVESIDLASPSCTAALAGNEYMGFMAHEEVVNFLNILLEAERAGARAAVRLAIDTNDRRQSVEMRETHANEVYCCRLLIDELDALGAKVSPRIGDFYDKLMAIPSIDERVVFLAKGQRWVARKIRENLPKIRSDRLHWMLAEMLSLHDR